MLSPTQQEEITMNSQHAELTIILTLAHSPVEQWNGKDRQLNKEVNQAYNGEFIKTI